MCGCVFLRLYKRWMCTWTKACRYRRRSLYSLKRPPAATAPAGRDFSLTHDTRRTCFIPEQLIFFLLFVLFSFFFRLILRTVKNQDRVWHTCAIPRAIATTGELLHAGLLSQNVYTSRMYLAATAIRCNSTPRLVIFIFTLNLRIYPLYNTYPNLSAFGASVF